MTPRAPALPPEQRRAAIIEAAAPLLLDDPGGFTTRRVAEAAQVAEGTIFRHFPTKADLIDAVTAHVMDPAERCELIRAATGSTVEQRVVQILDLMREGVADVSRLMVALTTAGADLGPGTSGPAHHTQTRPTQNRPSQNRHTQNRNPQNRHAEHRHAEHRERMAAVDAAIAAALAPFADDFGLPLALVAWHLRCLAFTASHHPMVQVDGLALTSTALTQVFLHGVTHRQES